MPPSTSGTTGVDRAVGRLILLIGDEDEAVARGAILALHDLGPNAFLGPLDESFAKSTSFRMRGMILAMILEYDTIGRPRVIESLLAAQTKIGYPGLAQLIQVVINPLTLPQLRSRQSAETAAPTSDPAGS